MFINFFNIRNRMLAITINRNKSRSLLPFLAIPCHCSLYGCTFAPIKLMMNNKNPFWKLIKNFSIFIAAIINHNYTWKLARKFFHKIQKLLIWVIARHDNYVFHSLIIAYFYKTNLKILK